MPYGSRISNEHRTKEQNMISATGSAITPRDFNKDTKDQQRDEWSPGAMDHLVKALNGAPVAIVLDKQTGFCEVNVTLGGVRANGRGHYEVLVQRTYSDGKTGGCWYLLFQVGAVITLGEETPGLGSRYTAYQAYSEERTRAIRQLQDALMVELGIDDRYQLPRGKWAARSFPGFVHASFDPEKRERGGLLYTWKRYEASALAAAE
jgi:hypothetical protein